jgi:hypothetical protein
VLSYSWSYFIKDQNEITYQARKVMKNAIFDIVELEVDEFGNPHDSRTLAEIMESGDSASLMDQMDAMLTDFGPQPKSVD